MTQQEDSDDLLTPDSERETIVLPKQAQRQSFASSYTDYNWNSPADHGCLGIILMYIIGIGTLIWILVDIVGN